MNGYVERVHPTILNAEDVLLVGERITPEVQDVCSENSWIMEVLGKVTGGVNELRDAVNKTNGNVFTAQLAQADDVRVNAFNALRGYVNGWCNRDDEPAIATAAKKVYSVMKETGLGISALGYNDKSVVITSILNQLAEPDMAETISTLEAKVWIDNLANAHLRFKKVFRKKIAKKAENDVMKKNAAKEICEFYLNILLSDIDFLKDTHNGGRYDPMVEKVNEIISGITAIARARRTRENHEEPVEETEGDSDAAVQG